MYNHNRKHALQYSLEAPMREYVIIEARLAVQNYVGNGVDQVVDRAVHFKVGGQYRFKRTCAIEDTTIAIVETLICD